jgi:hypothetical protein
MGVFLPEPRVRDSFKAWLLKVVRSTALKDAKFACWSLERGWPREFAPVYREMGAASARQKKKSACISFWIRRAKASKN